MHQQQADIRMPFTFAQGCVMTVQSTVRTAKDKGLKSLALSRTERGFAVASLCHICSVIRVGWVVSHSGFCNLLLPHHVLETVPHVRMLGSRLLPAQPAGNMHARI